MATCRVTAQSLTILHSFSGSDGTTPTGELTSSGNTLYGTTYHSVFRINRDGTSFTNLHSFFPTPIGGPDGLIAGVVLSDNILYGTASWGGSADQGAVFAVKIDGTSFTLYGTVSGGGSSGWGTAFAINIDGTSFTNLCNFTQATGDYPWAGLILGGNELFGTAAQAGTSGGGTVFSIAFLPRLTIAPTDSNVVFTWPANVAGFDYGGYSLQSTTNLASPVWTTNLPAPVIVNGQYTVSNPISGTQQFFRLSR